MKKPIYKTIINCPGILYPKKWLKSLCEILLQNANQENEILHAVQDEPYDIEELVCEQFAKANPDLEYYADDIVKYLVIALYEELCILYDEDTVLIKITLHDKFFELCKELDVAFL